MTALNIEMNSYYTYVSDDKITADNLEAYKGNLAVMREVEQSVAMDADELEVRIDHYEEWLEEEDE